jgi:predicted transposase/invertase (TIGR01784 family)
MRICRESPIKAKAIRGVANTVSDSAKLATLISLIEISLHLDQEEENRFMDIINQDEIYKEVKMLQSVEEWGLEKGMEKGLEKGLEKGMEKGKIKGREETALNLLKMGMLTNEQIAQATNLPLKQIKTLAKNMK